LVLITIPGEQSATSKLRAGRQDCLLRYFEISQAVLECSHDQFKTNYSTSSPPDGPWLERFRGEVVLTKATHVASAISDPVCGLRVFFPCGRALKVTRDSSGDLFTCVHVYCFIAEDADGFWPNCSSFLHS